ncbi:MAG: rod shape-determining protein MreC [Candidatus Pacebacteria bacterium]|jgi:cell shape-determining protein MreC|nr:rod shape-determining protein MreC [Candidatus Paceibacterota bacterium]
MSYLRNKALRQRKIFHLALTICAVVLAVVFRAPLGTAFSKVAHGVAWPFLELKQSISEVFSVVQITFQTKETLVAQNEALLQELEEAKLANLERDILFADNVALRAALERPQTEGERLVATILSKPNKSPYDTLVIDIGTDTGITPGATVFARGSVPIGMIDEVYRRNARVRLFSTPKESTQVTLKNGIQIDIVGTGGGSFKATLPRDITIVEGDILTLPLLTPQIVAVVKKIVSDSRDPFQTILATSPVNIQELKFVEVEK